MKQIDWSYNDETTIVSSSGANISQMLTFPYDFKLLYVDVLYEE